MALTISQALTGNSSKPLARGNQAAGESSNLFSNQSVNQNGVEAAQTSDVEGLVAKQQEAASRKSTDAVRKLNDAALFTAVGKSAAGEIDRLLAQAEEGAKRLQGSLSAEDSAALKTDLEAIGAEITSIANNATFNGSSVIEAGDNTFSGSLQPGDESSATDFSVTISNIGLSAESLGVSLTGAALNDPEALEETIKQARLSVGSEITKLEDTEDKIVEIAERAGISGSAEVEAEARALTPVAVEELLSEASAEQLVNASGSLNSARVRDLLAEEPGRPESDDDSDSEENAEAAEEVERAEEPRESILDQIRQERREESNDDE